MPALARLDPLHTIALEFSDFGSVYSADGREHPVNGQTPVYVYDDSLRESPTPATSTPAPPVSVPGTGWPDWLTPDFLKARHFAARVVVAIVAIAIIIIVAIRLTRV